MRWKEILIGAVITLVVTVVGGLLVYSFTQDESEPAIEKLSYQIEKQVSFEGKDNQISIGGLKFANIGSEAAKNVTAEFRTGEKDAKLIEFKISNDGGAAVTRTISENKQSVSIAIKSLVPSEIISITYLLDKPDSVEFTMRSEKTIGKKGGVYRIKSDRSSLINDFLGDFVPFLILIAGLPLFFAIKWFNSSTSRGDSKNNIAFVLLHKGITDQALSIFKNSISEGKDGSLVLSNYAAALAIQGELEEACNYYEAAKFLARTKHENAVCEFNNSLIMFLADDEEKSIASLELSLELSKSEIKSYIKNSAVWGKILVESERMSNLVENA